MTREEVMEMAYESGMIAGYEGEPDLLERFAALVAAAERKNYEHTLALQQKSYEREIQIEVEAEREACAKVAKETVCDMHLGTGIKIYGTKAAAAIRARGQE
jgi:hypothetical protein